MAKIKTVKNSEEMKEEYLREVQKIQEKSLEQFEKGIEKLRVDILNRLLEKNGIK